MKVWITKWGLTRGIQEYEVEPPTASAHDMVKVGSWSYAHGEGKEWHRTLESAIDRAEEMRLAKIKSLEKSIAKFKKLSFRKEKP